MITYLFVKTKHFTNIVFKKTTDDNGVEQIVQKIK